MQDIVCSCIACWYFFSYFSIIILFITDTTRGSLTTIIYIYTQKIIENGVVLSAISHTGDFVHVFNWFLMDKRSYRKSYVVQKEYIIEEILLRDKKFKKTQEEHKRTFGLILGKRLMIKGFNIYTLFWGKWFICINVGKQGVSFPVFKKDNFSF